MKLLNWTLYSGGAIGADRQWQLAGLEVGLGKTIHYYAAGQPTPFGNFALTQAQLLEADPHLVQANRILGRRFPAKSQWTNNLLRRNFWQVKGAEAIFAISTITNNKVDGGTGWAVQMAIDVQKPVWVFDQELEKWFYWTGLEFKECDTPSLTKHFAGIGTREINAAGIKAIQQVFTTTLLNIN